MNVLSLFDGMSCGQIALNRLGIKYKNYYASEIDKYAIQVAQANYPETTQLGPVEFITKEMFGENKIDLIIGGSPCQGFSIAGKQLNFKDPRSLLFFEFVRLIKELNPKYFLLENVKMKKEYKDIITEYMGVEPIEINSALVSAQNRKRLYWTNIPSVAQPNDKDIVLRDVLEDIKEVKGTITPKEYNLEALCHHAGNANNINGHESIKRVYADSEKSPTLNSCSGGNREPKVICNESATKSGKAYSLTASYQGAVAWNSCERKQRTMVPVCDTDDVDPNIYNGVYYRKLTPIECERLQTVPDNYTDHVSKTQRYKMLGNGWTVDVICHILKNLTL